MIEETTGESYSPEGAFVAGLTGEGLLFGEPLRKFSTSRKIAAEKMGCMAPANFSSDAYAALRTTLDYPGLHNDLINILWLCTRKDDADTAEEYRSADFFTPDRALDNPAAARKAARLWAESVGVDDKLNEPYKEARAAFFKIALAIDVSLFEVDTDNEGRPKDESPPPKTEPGPPNSRNSSRGSRKKPGTPLSTSGKSSRTSRRSTTTRSGGKT